MYITIIIYVPWHLIFFCSSQGSSLSIAQAKAAPVRCTTARMESRSLPGLLLFPVAEMYFFRCGNFLGCKAGLSLLLVFFLPRPVFFLPRTGFFPPRTVFSRCLQNAFFLLQRCFCAAARCFFCCFEFFPLRSGIFCWRFFPLRKQLFPAARRFFPAAKRVFSVPIFFPAANLCFSRAARRQGARERRVIHWAFATCKLDSAWTNR